MAADSALRTLIVDDEPLAVEVITHPRFSGFWRSIRPFQASVAAMMSKVAAPLSLAVSTVVLTSASACAAHMAR